MNEKEMHVSHFFLIFKSESQRPAPDWRFIQLIIIQRLDLYYSHFLERAEFEWLN